MEMPENDGVQPVIESLNDSEPGNIPKIIYASRTHTQLTQVIKELRETSYSDVKVALFASRDQLCIHPDLALVDNETKMDMCKSKTKLRPIEDRNPHRYDCSYYDRYKSMEESGSFRATHLEGRILDVEDLRRSGTEHSYCPYFMSKKLVDDADIVFMPYNYLLDPKIRYSIGVELRNAVIIFDEAHNVPQVCEDSASIEFKSTHIADALLEVKKVGSFASYTTTWRICNRNGFFSDNRLYHR